MNEGTKTGIFWVVAVAMIGIATIVAWPKTAKQNDNRVGLTLFETFSDPLAASSMKIVTFDEEQGQLETFEVRKDRETDLWTIPSRDGYPADAIEQMKNAANAFVGLKILDIQTSNAEDHDDLGVAEPKLEDLEVGDEGVGRLVSFKDDGQESLASLIIGDALKDDPNKRYVRIPGQDPVYVVKLDETPLTTKFQDWIEDDLLQLSSIDIEDVEIKDYSASLGIGGQISLTRTYTADVELDGADWKLASLLEYDPKNPMADPKPVTVGADQTLNKAKLDELKNALDDLKIADVVRKPDGMSANLRANQDLLSDKDAVGSLAQRGFYPVPSGPNGEIEILSANGELNVTLKEGVKYVMRFGNIAGVSDDNSDESPESDGGVNRYLLVTTMVDQTKFPPPDLKPVPKTLEELDAILNPPKQAEESAPAEQTDAKPEETEQVEATADDAATGKKDASEDTDSKESADEAPAEEAKVSEEPAPEATETEAPETETSEESSDAPSEEAGTEEGESEDTGSGEASGSGNAQETSEDADESEESSEDSNADSADGDTENANKEKSTPDDQSNADAPDAKAKDDANENPADDAEELTEEEKLEQLEAEQEKITKENQRKLDERKDRLEEAERRVRELNARFADWYYVIPEDTYSKLRIKRDELFANPAAAAPAQPGPNGGPAFNFNSLPGGIPGN